MKIIVVGGSGLIGSKLVNKLRQSGHIAVDASPRANVNAVTGAGLDEVFARAEAVVDVTNAPSFDDNSVMAFFRASGQNILRAEAVAGVRHHITLSIVGADRNAGSGYMRAKIAQEGIVKTGSVPYTIVRSTQFFEFMGGVADVSAVGDGVVVSPAPVQPIAADDVVATLAEVAASPALNATIEIAGPERMPLNEAVQRYLTSRKDPRDVTSDVHARYFGIELNDRSLMPGDDAHIGTTRYEDWLKMCSNS